MSNLLMAGTYIRLNQSENEKVNFIIDNMINPHIIEFRQINISHEPGIKVSFNEWKFAYSNWNKEFRIQVYLNNDNTPLDDSLYNVNHERGEITINDADKNDNIIASYSFDYFGTAVLEGFVHKAVSYINVGATGPLTDYTINDSPRNWQGVIADMALSYLMEKLIAEYDLWKGKLIFAISPQGLIDGNDNVVGQLETIRSSAWERVSMALGNERFKMNEYTAPPSATYYQAILFGGGNTRSKQHNIPSMGKLRGLRTNRYGLPR